VTCSCVVRVCENMCAVLYHRPSFKELTPRIQLLLDMVKEEEARKAASSSGGKGGLLSKLNLRKDGSKDVHRQ